MTRSRILLTHTNYPISPHSALPLHSSRIGRPDIVIQYRETEQKSAQVTHPACVQEDIDHCHAQISFERMAHRHNRRRVRPRSKPSNILCTSDSIGYAMSTGGFFDFERNEQWYTTSGTGRTSKSLPTPIVAKHWHNRLTAWQNRDTAQKREANKIEAERLRLFGGEPGDDPSLCFKMLEAFASMDWVNC